MNPSDPEDALIWAGDLESGSLAGWGHSRNPDRVSVVDDLARVGSHSVQLSLAFDEGWPVRTELLPAPTPMPPGPSGGGGGTPSPFWPSFSNEFDVGGEYWYGFSVHLPTTWVPDPSDRLDTHGDDDIVMQLHERPDFHLGETWRAPPVSLRIERDRWKVKRRWDSKPVTTVDGEQQYEGTEVFDLGRFSTGRWTDWVFHVRWSYGPDGILQVWRDGVLVVDVSGPVGYNDRDGLYLKTGIYKPSWASTSDPGPVRDRLLHLDEYRIAGADGSYESVAPGGSSTFVGTVDRHGTDEAHHEFDVTSPATVPLAVDWTDEDAELDLVVRDPTGAVVASSNGARPARLLVDAARTGSWTATVVAVGGTTPYRLTIRNPERRAPWSHTMVADDHVFTEVPLLLSGSAGASAGVARVDVIVQDRRTKQWLQSDGSFGPGPSHPFAAELVPAADGTASWFLELDLPDGTYGFHSIATDRDRDREPPADQDWTRFEVRRSG